MLSKINRIFVTVNFTALIFIVIYGCDTNKSISFEFERGDRIAIIGNSLAERMQHEGWIESYVQMRYPKDSLVFRNLGYSGDQIHYRPRAHKGFGDSHDHLSKMKANVIFAFFGYNEAYDNNPDEYKKTVKDWIDHTLKQDYGTNKTPKIVLFSPIAHENLKKAYLPDGKENNTRLEAYTRAMSEAAQEKQVHFVDLFSASQNMYKRRRAKAIPPHDRAASLAAWRASRGSRPRP